ncbi:MAG: F0F1 ATP synthase subunit B' [Paracoccaceae bacterium]
MASETTAVEHVADNAPGMPQLDFSTFPNQIFWLVVTFIVLYFVISRVALPRIGSVLDDRRNAIANDITQAAEFKNKAQDAEAAYNTALAEARTEAMRIADEAKAEIKQDLDVAIAKADAEIAVQAAESAAHIEEIRESAVKSIKEVAGVAAPHVVAAIMPSVKDDKALKAAIAARLKG